MPQKQRCDTHSGQGGVNSGYHREKLDATTKHRLWLWSLSQETLHRVSTQANSQELAPELLTNITAPGPTCGCLTAKDTQLGPKYINIPWENGNFLAAF